MSGHICYFSFKNYFLIFEEKTISRGHALKIIFSLFSSKYIKYKITLHQWASLPKAFKAQNVYEKIQSYTRALPLGKKGRLAASKVCPICPQFWQQILSFKFYKIAKRICTSEVSLR